MTEENISKSDAVPTESGQTTGSDDTETDAASDLKEQLTELEGKQTERSRKICFRKRRCI